MGVSTVKGWREGAVQWDRHADITMGSDYDCSARCVGIYVGISGTIVAEDQAGTEATYTNVPVGILQGRFKKIIDSTTDADEMTELIYVGSR